MAEKGGKKADDRTEEEKQEGRLRNNRGEGKKGAGLVVSSSPFKSKLKRSNEGASGSNGSGDQMRTLLQQLSVLLSNQNQIHSSCGIVSHSENFNLLDQIIIDSGATDHMFGNEKFLTNLKLSEPNQYVSVANGIKEKINYVGEINIFNKKINKVLF